ncbi:hypothetical protein ACFLSQ_01060 [Bacteroidota bacterium]
MNDLYKDYYVQQKVEKELSIIERNLIDEAEKRYIAEGREEELYKMTIGILIEEQEKLTYAESINNITSIELIDKLIIEKDSVRLMRWKMKIRNNGKKDIIKVQGWLYILGPKTKEILRRDTINCALNIPSGKSVHYTTNPVNLNYTILASKIIEDLSVDSLRKYIEWQPLSVMFGDSTQILKTNM